MSKVSIGRALCDSHTSCVCRHTTCGRKHARLLPFVPTAPVFIQVHWVVFIGVIHLHILSLNRSGNQCGPGTVFPDEYPKRKTLEKNSTTSVSERKQWKLPLRLPARDFLRGGRHHYADRSLFLTRQLSARRGAKERSHLRTRRSLRPTTACCGKTHWIQCSESHTRNSEWWGAKAEKSRRYRVKTKFGLIGNLT